MDCHQKDLTATSLSQFVKVLFFTLTLPSSGQQTEIGEFSSLNNLIGTIWALPNGIEFYFCLWKIKVTQLKILLKVWLSLRSSVVFFHNNIYTSWAIHSQIRFMFLLSEGQWLLCIFNMAYSLNGMYIQMNKMYETLFTFSPGVTWQVRPLRTKSNPGLYLVWYCCNSSSPRFGQDEDGFLSSISHGASLGSHEYWRNLSTATILTSTSFIILTTQPRYPVN